MSDAAAIRATFSDFRIVKGRKVCQLVFEVPLEQADAALATVGGLPQPAEERWCGIARLDMSKASSAPEKPAKRAFSDLPIAQRAALLCGREAFQRFAYDRWAGEGRAPYAPSEEEAAQMVREWCAVKSRSELATNVLAATRFERLEREFNDWLAEPL